jgi:hypothetical protein
MLGLPLGVARRTHRCTSHSQKQRCAASSGSIDNATVIPACPTIGSPNQHAGSRGGGCKTNEPTHGAPPFQTFGTGDTEFDGEAHTQDCRLHEGAPVTEITGP